MIPDLCTLSKILTGGLPGGALVGSERFMERITRPIDDRSAMGAHVSAQSTFAGHALTAAAGLASLTLAGDGRGQIAAEANADALCQVFNQTAMQVGSRWRAFRTRSIVHYAHTSIDGETIAPSRQLARQIQRDQELHQQLTRAWSECGVLAHPNHAWVSTAHDEGVLAYFRDATRAALNMIREKGA